MSTPKPDPEAGMSDGGLEQLTIDHVARCAALSVGDAVRTWPGKRGGLPVLMFVAYEGVHDIGGTPCLYVRPMGSHRRAVALTHIEVPS